MQHQRQQYRNSSRLLKTPALAALVALLVSCSDAPQAPAPAAEPAQPVVSAPAVTAPPKIEEKAADEYSYKPAGRRDPFAPIISKQDKNKPALGDRPPLERYTISEFKLAGIIWGGFGYNAMLEGPDGKGYFIRRGTVIGPNRGVVKKITSNAVVIEEKYRNAAGETESKEITVELRKKQEETP